MDLVGGLLLNQLVAKACELILDRDIRNMGGDAQPLRQSLLFAKPLGFRHRLGRDVAHGDIAALGDELARQLAAHARAASGDDGDISGKIDHGTTSTVLRLRKLYSR